jgi:hypothetical protein
MNKIILSTSVLIVAVFTVAFLYFSNISASGLTNDKALSLIPNDAALIFQFKNDLSIYEIFSDYPVFDAVIGKQKEEELSALKSVLLKSGKPSNSSLGQNIFLSFHPLENDAVAFLWVMPIPPGISGQELIESLKENNNIQYSESLVGKKRVSQLYIKSLKRIFFLQVDQNIVSGSFSRETMENSLNEKTEKIRPELVEEINRASNQNQNTPASIFVNFKNSISFLSKFLKNKPGSSFSMLNNFNGIATLNMNFKSDALMFNGITETDTSDQNYLNLFLHQQPIRNPIKRLVPDNTANYTVYGFSDYATFHKELEGLLLFRKELDQLTQTLTRIKEETGIDARRDIQKYLANEFITFQLSTQERYAAVQLTNGRQMQFFLEPVSSMYSGNIRQLNYPGLLYYYFGDGLKQFDKPFFAIVDNQMIISNSASSIERYLTRYNRHLLYENDKFMSFDQLVADRSNISIFIHTRNSGSNISSELKPGYSSIFRNDNYGLKDFYGFSYQWSSEGDHFFTNFYAGFKQKPMAAETADNLE